MTIEICIGSSCYVKGSDKVVLLVKEILVNRGLDAKVELKGSFCMNACTQGIGVKIDGKMIRKHACIDGPEIDSHIIDWDKFLPRFGQFRAQEAASRAAHGLG